MEVDLNNNRYLRNKRKDMTICIAAICEINTPSPKIVFCADRLISAGIQFEHGQSKITPIKTNCWVMQSSNDSLKSDEIVKNVQKEVSKRAPALTDLLPVDEVVSIFRDQCKKLYSETIQREIFFKYGLDYDQFQKKQKEFSPEFTKTILNEIQNYIYNFEASFLLVSLESAPHIYTINSDGSHKLMDFLGFAAIGSGGEMAFTEFTKYSYSSMLTLSEAILRVYNAKSVSERVQGVGRQTDLVVLHIAKDGKCAFWEAPLEIHKTLAEAMDEKIKSETKIYLSVMEKLTASFSETNDSVDSTKNQS